MKVCHNCTRELTLGDYVGRDEVCPLCRYDLRCCLNCRFHDPSAANQCLEPETDWVGDREKANFCDYFTFRETTGDGVESPVSAAKRKLDDLFRK